MLTFHPMAHRSIGDDVIPVAAPLTMPREAPRSNEILHNALDGAFGDADLLGKIAQAELGVTYEADEHVTVIGEERPASFVDEWFRRCAVDSGSSHHQRLGNCLPEPNFR